MPSFPFYAAVAVSHSVISRLAGISPFSRKLLRVISRFVNGSSVPGWLEDCVTLAVGARGACELDAIGRRAVGNTGARAARARSSTSTLAVDPAALR
jgi:hypothetical protein